jgi:hypothetical protein
MVTQSRNKVIQKMIISFIASHSFVKNIVNEIVPDMCAPTIFHPGGGD